VPRPDHPWCATTSTRQSKRLCLASRQRWPLLVPSSTGCPRRRGALRLCRTGCRGVGSPKPNCWSSCKRARAEARGASQAHDDHEAKLPKPPLAKSFKPDLRQKTPSPCVYDETLEAAGVPRGLPSVTDDKKTRAGRANRYERRQPGRCGAGLNAFTFVGRAA